MFERVDSLVLVYLRIVVAISIYGWADGFLSGDRYREIFLEPSILFKYSGWEWVSLWPGQGIYWHFMITKVAAVCFAIGLLTRVAAALMCGSITYVLLVACETYSDQQYLLACAVGLCVFLPVARRWSLDVQIGIERREPTFWRWQLWLLRFQFGLPFVFGAISLAFCRDNAWALATSVCSWFMIAAMVVYLPAETLPRRWRLFLGQPPLDQRPRETTMEFASVSRWTKVTFILAAIYVGIQTVVPLRCWLYPGDANWNERGRRFAWQMFGQRKVALTHYLVVDKNSSDFLYVPATVVLTVYQSTRANANPELIRQTAIEISQAAVRLGVPENRVYALALVSLRGRRPEPIVEPTIDLTMVKRGWWRDDWVRQSPGERADPPWSYAPEQWWKQLELPEPFKRLQGRTPAELQQYLNQLSLRPHVRLYVS